MCFSVSEDECRINQNALSKHMEKEAKSERVQKVRDILK